jgi:hypothetical protein
MTPKLKSRLTLTAVAAAPFLALGCSPVNDTATPGYTWQERDIEIRRNISMEGKMLLDDVDRHVLMWRPVSQLSYWNIRKMSP